MHSPLPGGYPTELHAAGPSLGGPTVILDTLANVDAGWTRNVPGPHEDPGTLDVAGDVSMAYPPSCATRHDEHPGPPLVNAQEGPPRSVPAPRQRAKWAAGSAARHRPRAGL